MAALNAAQDALQNQIELKPAIEAVDLGEGLRELDGTLLTVTYWEAWCCANPTQEARSLLPLLRTAGQTVADVLDLIRVAPEEEKLLRAFAEKFPDLKSNVERSLDYRLRVEKEFCRLACGMGAPRPEDSMSAGTMQL